MGKILTEEERNSLPKIAAIDFDGTLVGFTHSGIGKPDFRMIWLVLMMKLIGVKVILWTCRNNDNEERELDAAVEFCREFGLEFDAINDNIPEVIELSGSNPRKILADVYIDDKSMFEASDIEGWLGGCYVETVS